MTSKGRKRRQRTPESEPLIDELTVAEQTRQLWRRDFTDSDDRNLFESEHGPEMRDDADDSPKLATAKPKFDDHIAVKQDPGDNLPGQMVADGHGFIVDDPRSRPWKTAPRTHCAHCAGLMPPPNVSDEKYRCEFDPDASSDELALIGAGQGPDPWKVIRQVLQIGSGCRHQAGCRCFRKGCQCSGCILRDLVLNAHERGRGQPRKYCNAECTRLAGNARNAWKRAVRSAEKRGEDPPAEPEDKGLKFRPVRDLRSSSEGTGRRYIAAVGVPWGAPRA